MDKRIIAASVALLIALGIPMSVFAGRGLDDPGIWDPIEVDPLQEPQDPEEASEDIQIDDLLERMIVEKYEEEDIYRELDAPPGLDIPLPGPLTPIESEGYVPIEGIDYPRTRIPVPPESEEIFELDAELEDSIDAPLPLPPVVPPEGASPEVPEDSDELPY